MALRFNLIKFSPVTIHRRAAGEYVDGDWVEGSITDEVVNLKVQPVKPFELMQFPESERSREWLKVYSDTNLRSQLEGVDGNWSLAWGESFSAVPGWGADEFQWESIVDGRPYTFRIMKTYRFKDSSIDHWKGWAARLERTPN